MRREGGREIEHTHKVFTTICLPDECAVILCEKERARELEAGQCLFEGRHSGPAQWLESFIQDGCILPLEKTKVGHLR